VRSGGKGVGDEWGRIAYGRGERIPYATLLNLSGYFTKLEKLRNPN